MDERELLRARAAAGGLELPEERVDALLAGLRRLEATARWLRERDARFTEPALVFDVQAGGEREQE